MKKETNQHKNTLKNSRKLSVDKFLESYENFTEEEQQMIIDSKLLSLRALTLKLTRLENSIDERTDFKVLLKINNKMLEIRNIRKRLMTMRYDITLKGNS